MLSVWGAGRTVCWPTLNKVRKLASSIESGSVVVRRPRRLIVLELADVFQHRPGVAAAHIAEACEGMDDERR